MTRTLLYPTRGGAFSSASRFTKPLPEQFRVVLLHPGEHTFAEFARKFD